MSYVKLGTPVRVTSNLLNELLAGIGVGSKHSYSKGDIGAVVGCESVAARRRKLARMMRLTEASDRKCDCKSYGIPDCDCDMQGPPDSPTTPLYVVQMFRTGRTEKLSPDEFEIIA